MSGGEFLSSEVNETKTQKIENYKSIKPENEMSAKELNNAVSEEFGKASKEADSFSDKTIENLNPSHKECMTSSMERRNFAEHSDGKWEGEPGNSIFHPEKQEAKEALGRYSQDGVDYKDGEPDFSNVSEATVKIDNMTSERYGPGKNFNQANQKCAEQWNKEARDGKIDWKARDVENWRLENCYTWHERLDRKTMDLVQRDVHEECKHFGGVAECKRYEAIGKAFGGGFDE